MATLNKIAELEKAYNSNKILTGKVKKVTEDMSLIIDLGDGVTAEMLKDDVTLSRNSRGVIPESVIINMYGKILKFKIKSFEKKLNKVKILVSKKELEIEARQKLSENLKPNTVVVGKVKSLQQYGVFVEIDEGVVGLLHIQDISVARTKHPSERFNIGDKIKVLIKDFDKNTGKITLSYKDLLGDWEENASKYTEGTEVYGIARDREKNGIFVELAPNLVGLAEHKSGIEYGQKVKVYIKKIVNDKKKIKLVII